VKVREAIDLIEADGWGWLPREAAIGNSSTPRAWAGNDCWQTIARLGAGHAQ